MATQPIEDAAHITFRMHQTATGEIQQVGFSTIKRADFDIVGLLDDMETWYEEDGASLSAQSNLDEIVYAEWGSSGFTGFHQVQVKMVSVASGSGAITPPQCATTVSLLNLQEPGDSIKRRRGRMYWGPVPVSHLGSDGRLTTGVPTLFEDAMATLQAALLAAAGVNDATSGLCIASAAAGLLYSADAVGVGRGVDTQRRRREKVSEEITYNALTEL